MFVNMQYLLQAKDYDLVSFWKLVVELELCLKCFLWPKIWIWFKKYLVILYYECFYYIRAVEHNNMQFFKKIGFVFQTWEEIPISEILEI